MDVYIGEMAVRKTGKAEAPEDGKKRDRAKSCMAWILGGFDGELGTRIEENRGLGTTTKFGRY